jgi:hypothetical protein
MKKAPHIVYCEICGAVRDKPQLKSECLGVHFFIVAQWNHFKIARKRDKKNREKYVA